MEEFEAKVRQECANNLKLAIRRFNFLRDMPKSMRPINHNEVVSIWTKVLKEFSNITTL